MVHSPPESTHTPKRRKPRPSRGRGLRTNTGCLTCRQRRLKCDESRPICGQCTKSSRDCAYPQEQSEPHHDSLSHSSPVDAPPARTWNQPSSPPGTPFNNTRPISSGATSSHPSHDIEPASTHFSHTRSTSFGVPPDYVGQEVGPAPRDGSPKQDIVSPRRPPSDYGLSPLTQTSSFTPGAAPFEWYDLLAQDAVKNIDNYNFLRNSGSRWSFEPNRFAQNVSTSQTIHGRVPPPPIERSPPLSQAIPVHENVEHSRRATEPWNTTEPAPLRETELRYFQFFVNIVGPILDLFDSKKHFTNHVPHIALHNVGLLKSLLAVSARYRGFLTSGTISSTPANAQSPSTPASQLLQDEDMGIQYYYETLNYLAQAMQYPSYTRSTEILATALLISAYEGVGSDSSMDWERHLKGVFWIQRSQNNNGERGGLTSAVWWQWLRQDIWAALKHGRKTLTIWKPTKPLSALTPEELACRACYLQAKAVSYASDEARQTADLVQRIEEGDILLKGLQDWHDHLPISFKPLPAARTSLSKAAFPPLWIHPPMFAAAMQAYSSAKILILLNKPSVGGVLAYHDSQKMLDEAVTMICGIAQAPNASEIPSALINVQALSIAGQCVRTKAKQEAIADLLNRTLDVTKFPSKSTIDDLRGVWSSAD